MEEMPAIRALCVLFSFSLTPSARNSILSGGPRVIECGSPMETRANRLIAFRVFLIVSAMGFGSPQVCSTREDKSSFIFFIL